MDIDDLIALGKKSEFVIWVGAGVSATEPTMLPLGFPLLKFILDQICGDDVQNRIIEVWEKSNSIIKSAHGSDSISVVPRLELIIDVVMEVEKLSRNLQFSFVKGFQSFTEAPYNDRHVYLAKLLSMGATIVTTNFDDCIERAYLNEFLPTDASFHEEELSGVMVFRSKRSEVGEIWHIHGLATDISSLGVTVSKLKEGFQKETQRALDDLFGSKKVVVFLGYSFGDSFDVNPFLETRGDLKYQNMSAYFIQHGVKGSIGPSVRIATLLRPFASVKVGIADTSDALAGLAGERRIIAGSFDWIQSFKKHTKMVNLNELRPFVTCMIANLIGVSINKLNPNAYKESLPLETFFPTAMFHDVMAVTLRNMGNYRLEMEHHLNKTSKLTTVGTSPPTEDLLGYYYSRGNFGKARRFSQTLDEIHASAEGASTELPWRSYTSLSTYARPFINRRLINIFNRRITPKDVRLGLRLLDLAERLGEKPLSNVNRVNQLATALRFNILLKSLLYGEDDVDAEKRVLYLYGEGSSVEGFVSAYRDVSIKNVLLYRFYRDKRFLSFARIFAKQSRDLANVVGNKRSSVNAKSLLVYISVLQFIDAI